MEGRLNFTKDFNSFKKRRSVKEAIKRYETGLMTFKEVLKVMSDRAKLERRVLGDALFDGNLQMNEDEIRGITAKASDEDLTNYLFTGVIG